MKKTPICLVTLSLITIFFICHEIDLLDRRSERHFVDDERGGGMDERNVNLVTRGSLDEFVSPIQGKLIPKCDSTDEEGVPRHVCVDMSGVCASARKRHQRASRLNVRLSSDIRGRSEHNSLFRTIGAYHMRLSLPVASENGTSEAEWTREESDVVDFGARTGVMILTTFNVHKKRKPESVSCYHEHSRWPGRLYAQGMDLWQQNVTVVIVCPLLPCKNGVNEYWDGVVDVRFGGERIRQIEVAEANAASDAASSSLPSVHACLAPIFPNEWPHRTQMTRAQLVQLLEWIEYHLKVVGVEHIYVYPVASPDDDAQLHRVLDVYERRGTVTTVSWWFVRNIGLYYYGQVLSVNHCIASNRYASDFLLTADVDEFVHASDTGASFLEQLAEWSRTRPYHGALALQSWPHRRADNASRLLERSLINGAFASAADMSVEDLALTWQTLRDEQPEEHERRSTTWYGRRKNVVRAQYVRLHVVHQMQFAAAPTDDADVNSVYLAHLTTCDLKKYYGASTTRVQLVDEQQTGRLVAGVRSVLSDAAATSAFSSFDCDGYAGPKYLSCENVRGRIVIRFPERLDDEVERRWRQLIARVCGEVGATGRSIFRVDRSESIDYMDVSIDNDSSEKFFHCGAVPPTSLRVDSSAMVGRDNVEREFVRVLRMYWNVFGNSTLGDWFWYNLKCLK